LLLVLYGTLNLWLPKSATVPPSTKRSFCDLLLCQPSNNDSPTALDDPPAEPLPQAKQALLLEPASAYRWAALADSEMNAKNLESGKFCVRQALASAPGNPAILFRAANFYLRIEDYPKALEHLISVLRNPDLAPYYDRVFTLYSEMDLPLADLLNQGVPHSTAAANGFLRFWINQNKLEEAQETFKWINQNSLASIQSAGSYTALLAKDGRWDDAMASWTQDTEKLDPGYGKTNWIYNGSFEAPPVDCPFDWHLVSHDAAQVDRDGEAAYKGNSSLRIRFLDTPKDSSPLAYETVLLTPGKWQIKAAMKTAGLTGEQGIVVRVVDAEDVARLDAASNTFARTQEWTSIGCTFEVGPKTHLARVEIMRPPGRETGIRLTGTVWLDNLSLAPQQ
jgi:tetratricopeptide (TPR) repeat protein